MHGYSRYIKLIVLIVGLIIGVLVIRDALPVTKQNATGVGVGDVQKLIADPIPDMDAAKDRNYGSRIPKIIHQYWDDEIIPTEMVENVRLMVLHNPPPQWKYYFWTLKSAREMIRRRYPSFLETFDNYPDNKCRADASRYVILHEYGGVYFDLDFVSLKPLDPFLDQHSCAFVQAPHEHKLVQNIEFLINNGAMFCRPRHQFFKYLIDGLPDVLAKRCTTVYVCTGPLVNTKFYKQYEAESFQDKADIVPTELFQDKYSVRLFGKGVRRVCNNTKSLSTSRKEICDMWNSRGQENRTVSEKAFLYHTFNFSQRKGPYKSVTFKPENNITRIVPFVQLYK